MRGITCAAAALIVSFSLACKDRDRDDADSRLENAAEETEETAREGGSDVKEAAKEVKEEAKDAANNLDDLDDESYAERDEFRREVRDRIAALDRELGELKREMTTNASQARKNAIAAAQDARTAAGRDFERLSTATAANWEELKRQVHKSLNTAELQVRGLRPDAKPMGGTGGPS